MNLDRRLDDLEARAGNGRRSRIHVAYVNAEETDLSADPPRFAGAAAFETWAGQLSPRDVAVAFEIRRPAQL